MEVRKEDPVFRMFFISISLTIGLCLSAVFLGLAIRSRELINEEILARARTHFNGIVMTRKWNALHGGVYVLKQPGASSNPYLADPDITDTQGRVYTKKNPALMTREISEIADKEGQFTFHITSLKPLNPGNAPDPFEARSLEAFERGASEMFAKSAQDGKVAFRYMAPLVTEEPCLACHRDQGYKLGDIRGGVSVSFDVDAVQRKLDQNNLVILAFSLLTVASLIALVYFFFRQMKTRLHKIREELRVMATTDALTGICNRGHLLERFHDEFERFKRHGGELGCIIFDLDHFKRVNDTHGHQAGDEVLAAFAKLVAGRVRPYDIFGRYGGEEFLLVLPQTDCQAALAFAERMRDLVETDLTPRLSFALETPVTVSLGVTNANPADTTIDTVLKRADEALYRAKERGRNKVETC
ncbi:MAG: diguanylate cyclase [Desulfovibrionaceae bacterium]|nr:diguanylate cyclase [Desulfovibrionaceae bacterium]